MAKPFNVETEESRFRLPLLTRQQIKTLMTNLGQDARSIIIIAVTELYGREVESERDIFAELDAIKARLGL